MEWRAVVDWPNYEVSEHGDVRRLGGTPNCLRTRLLRPGSNRKTGYRYVSLCRDGRCWSFNVHGLVARAFLGPMEVGSHRDAMQVDHKDCNRQNNHWTNLEYVTHMENLRRGGQLKLTEEDVLAIRELRELGQPLKPIARFFGISVQQVCNLSKRRCWVHI